MKEQEYKVTWEVNVTATTDKEAAEIAESIQRGQSTGEPGYERGFFTVLDEHGNQTVQDLSEYS